MQLEHELERGSSLVRSAEVGVSANTSASASASAGVSTRFIVLHTINQTAIEFCPRGGSFEINFQLLSL